MKQLVVIIFLLISTISSFSQVNDIDANYHFEHDNFEVALKQYQRLYRSEPENSLYNYRIGICFLNTNIDKAASLEFLQFVQTDKEFKEELSYYLAQSYFYNLYFDSAFFYFDKSIQEFEAKDIDKVKKINLFKSYCSNAKNYIDNPLKVSFQNIGDNINSKSAEYNPRIINSNTMIYNSNRRYLSDIQVYVNNLYVSEFDNNIWSKGKSLGSKINSTEDDRFMGLSNDGNLLFIQRDDYSGFLDLYYSEKIRGRYKEVQKMDKNINSKYHESGAYLSENGEIFYFSSNRPGGFGGMDIYYSKKLPNGEWSEPTNLGSDINTEYDEEYPFFIDDDNTLYFSSNSDKSIGGYDLFVSYRKGLGNLWSEPANLGYPINSLYDNYFITFSDNKRVAYLSDVRPEGKGDYDIYKVIFDESEPDYQLFTGVISLNDTLFPITENSDINDIEINVYNSENEEIFGTYSYKKSDGKYVIALPPGKYMLEILGEYLLPYKKEIEIVEDFAFQKEINENIILKSK